MVDDQGGAFGEAPSEYESPAGAGSTHIGEGGHAETGVELALITGAQAAQRPVDAGGGQISDPEKP